MTNKYNDTYNDKYNDVSNGTNEGIDIPLRLSLFWRRQQMMPIVAKTRRMTKMTGTMTATTGKLVAGGLVARTW